MDTLVQVRALKAAKPAPLRLTTAAGLVEELLVMVRIPVNELTWGAENCRFSVAVWPGLRVRGVVTPAAVKSEPAMEMAEMVTGDVPVEDKVTGRVAVCPTFTLPKLRVVVLRASFGVPAFNCNKKLLEAPAAVAVSVTDCAEVNAETVAVNAALVALAGTVNVAGTVTAVLLLERLTASPPVGAAALSVTVQASVPAAENEPLVHESAERAAVEAPVPLRLTTAVGLEEELLVTVS
jgi:hypothetical protein